MSCEGRTVVCRCGLRQLHPIVRRAPLLGSFHALAKPTRPEPLLPLTLVCAGALPIMPPLGLALLSPHRRPVAIGRRIPPRGDARSQRLARSLERRALRGFNAATHAPRSRYRASRSTHSPSVMFSNGLSNGVPKGRFIGGKTRSDSEQISFCRCGPILAALDPCSQAPSNTGLSGERRLSLARGARPLQPLVRRPHEHPRSAAPFDQTTGLT
jgi:hypothetical protein